MNLEWLDRLVSVAIGAILGVIGSRVLDRVRARDSRRESAAPLVVVLIAIGVALRRHVELWDSASQRGPDALKGYCRFLQELLPAADVDELERRAREGAKFRHEILVALRELPPCLRGISVAHSRLREGIEISDAWLADREGYRRDLIGARDAVSAVMRRLRRECAPDGRKAVDRFLDG